MIAPIAFIIVKPMKTIIIPSEGVFNELFLTLKHKL